MHSDRWADVSSVRPGWDGWGRLDEWAVMDGGAWQAYQPAPHGQRDEIARGRGPRYIDAVRALIADGAPIPHHVDEAGVVHPAPEYLANVYAVCRDLAAVREVLAIPADRSVIDYVRELVAGGAR